MSFALTTEQFKNRTKTVTRRFGWSFLKPGDIVCGVEKSMGLAKGEKIKRLGLIEIVSIRKESLQDISQADVVAEGFWYWEPLDFIRFIMNHYDVPRDVELNRIEFKYLEGK